MIEKRELRTGSLVLVKDLECMEDGERFVSAVEEIQTWQVLVSGSKNKKGESFMGHSVRRSNMFGIPLSDKVLNCTNLRLKDGRFFKSYEKGGFRLKDPRPSGTAVYFAFNKIRHINYLHELQNLYQAFFVEEMRIDKEELRKILEL